MDCLEDKVRVYVDRAADWGEQYKSLHESYETLYQFISDGPLTCSVRE